MAFMRATKAAILPASQVARTSAKLLAEWTSSPFNNWRSVSTSPGCTGTDVAPPASSERLVDSSTASWTRPVPGTVGRQWMVAQNHVRRHDLGQAGDGDRGLGSRLHEQAPTGDGHRTLACRRPRQASGRHRARIAGVRPWPA
jgi:hypothetical protein